MTEATKAMEALEQARAIQAEVADRAACPPRSHAAFGALLSTMVAGEAAPPVYAVSILVLCLGAAVAMMRSRRRRMGFFVNGYRRGRTLRVALTLLVFVEGVLALGLWAKLGLHLWWAPLAGGALVFPAAVWGSYAWQAAYRRDLVGVAR